MEKRKRRTLWRCPYYCKWTGMLTRCYSDAYQTRQPTYKECTVCEEWLTFSKFRSWMITQKWKGKALDKDLLFESNKVYSPETCRFLHQRVNNFINHKETTRGKYMLGVSKEAALKKYKAHCNVPLKYLRAYYSKAIGHYDTELEAHLAWKKNRKLIYAISLIYSGYLSCNLEEEALISKYN